MVHIHTFGSIYCKINKIENATHICNIRENNSNTCTQKHIIFEKLLGTKAFDGHII